MIKVIELVSRTTPWKRARVARFRISIFSECLDEKRFYSMCHRKDPGW
jgi:hypothetical protein